MSKASKKLIKAAKRARKIARWLAKAERSGVVIDDPKAKIVATSPGGKEWATIHGKRFANSTKDSETVSLT